MLPQITERYSDNFQYSTSLHHLAMTRWPKSAIQTETQQHTCMVKTQHVNIITNYQAFNVHLYTGTKYICMLVLSKNY